MLQFLQGQAVGVHQTSQGRWWLILAVQQVGYELQIGQRFAQQLTPLPTDLIQVFTALIVRENLITLFGFSQLAERELFNQLISVAGIGPQLAIALIDTLGLEGLVQAVVTGNLNQLCRTPGVGKKSAERIALELKTKLAQWRQVQTPETPSAGILPETVLADVEMTLLALGYSPQEIHQAIAALVPTLGDNPDPELWIRQAILWLAT